ncbi:hypothetical protein FHR70_003495 [Microvirga lupini]|uniref:Uncharacterized protein n=1 Tax=Microvirga lupini TaxID=420324 RepID=A0A7W4VNG4_9HYPH|nr:hypothetical protein [Microvirga lupini]MBB3020414.1 hypothetical protein [Microvirga lupini]
MKKREPKKPSRLGLEIEAAVERDPRFERHQPNRLYQCTFRTVEGREVFAFERVTLDAIRFWLPPTEAVKKAVTAEGIVVPEISIPYPDRNDPERYGRLSNLLGVPELKDEPLLPVPIMSADQAIRILAALP